MKLALILAVVAAPAFADLRAEDQARLDGFDAALGRGLSQAMAGGALDDVQYLVSVMRGEPLAEPDLTGDWQCRVMKLGGNLPLVIYQPFACSVDADGTFRKTGGSQLKQGVIAGGLYRGVGFVRGDTPPDYAALPEVTDPQASPQILPEVAVVEQITPDMARMLFPAPFVESAFDVIEMTR